ncbi:MAG: GHMP family kinase ATP-binding protein [Promethearchaeota archaeon]|jgi:D-glycero-alpha-D-manno-heptose-7-phosphate kinase
MIFSRAPVRICDIGGWTDTWFFPNGAVFSICIDLYSHVRISPNNSKKVKMFSENLKLHSEINDLNDIKYDGNLDLLKAAIKRMNIKEGIDIYVNTEAPPSCGTGTSASVAVSTIAALTKFSNEKLNPKKIAQLAHKLEIEELGLESGVQDQYAAAFGGINFMEISYPSVNINPININNTKVNELERQLILIYLGSRKSNEMHKAVIKNFEKGDITTVNSFEIIKNCAHEMRTAIHSKDLSYMGELMNKNWEAQKKLHSLMVNPLITKAENISLNNGAIGFKLNGAGGGGSATIIAEIGKDYKLKRKLIENGFQILPVKLDFMGVQTWVI